MELSVFFAGTAGSVPSARRGLPALVVRRGAERILFDCGEGTQRQLVRSIGLPDITEIFLTHHHLDHWLGLPGMVKSFDLRDRDRPLTVYGPPGLADLMGAMRRVYGRVGYELGIVELEPDQEIRRGDLAIAPFAVTHRGLAYGYALVEDPRPGRFDVELATRLGVRPGPDFGRLQRGETVDGVRPDQVNGVERDGRRVVISGDTSPCQAVAEAADRADLLVHEATFTEDDRDRARMTRHTTARQAAILAADADVGLLALTHISARYAGPELRDEARLVFPETVVPRDFDTIEVPFPERGDPVLVRFDRGRPPAPASVPGPAAVPDANGSASTPGSGRPAVAPAETTRRL
ncbi:MAG TPA: ribonuclease Z [Solirubrobacteraceae bacterium]|nr:ribonuclease Z [Solirubrobacteraceae bacterium]